MRSLLLETRTVTPPLVTDPVVAVANPPVVSPAQICFGSLQQDVEVSVLPVTTTSLSLTEATTPLSSSNAGSNSKPSLPNSEPLLFLELAHHEVILGVNTEATAAMVNVTSASHGSSSFDCSKIIGSTVPFVDVNISRSFGNVRGSGHTSQTQNYFQHTNFGSHPFNYITGPFPATYLSANQGSIGFAPTAHVSSVEPTIPQFPSPNAQSHLI